MEQATFENDRAARARRLLVSGLRRDIGKTGRQEPACRHRQLMAGSSHRRVQIAGQKPAVRVEANDGEGQLAGSAAEDRTRPRPLVIRSEFLPPARLG